MQRALLFGLFAVHCVLRLGGLGWNIERHSAWPTPGVPTFHVDEELLVEGMRKDFHLFSGYSLVVDGPLSANLMYIPLAILGERPPDRFKAGDALLAGRVASAVADCLAFPALWLLLTSLGASSGAALFGVAVTTFAPNQVFNAHFARSHTIANLMQLLVMLATAKFLIAADRIERALWFGAAVLLTLLAGSARYPLLTLGILPAAVSVSILIQAKHRSELGPELRALTFSGLTAVILGLLIGFDFHPVRILQDAFAFQAATAQYNWHDIRGIAQSAQTKLMSVLQFVGGATRLVLLLGAPFILLVAKPKLKLDPARLLCVWVVFWAGIYLISWAKFSIPWQRYTIPLSTALLVPGVVGLTRASNRLGQLVGSRPMRVVTTVGAVALLVSPAYFCGLILYRFVRDDTHPLYRLALVLRDEPKRQIFIKNSWGWNLPLLDILPPERFTVHFVPSLEAACSDVRDGDLVVDLVFAPLTGRCSGVELSPVFHASNLGPPGYPFPADHRSPYTGGGADTVDYHYLFEDVTLSRLISTHLEPKVR